MASSELWREYWKLRDKFYDYVRVAHTADLAIDCWNPHMKIWTPITDGGRHVPFCICQGFDSDRKPFPGFDIRCHPYWRTAYAFFPGLFAEQANQINPGCMAMVAGSMQFVKPYNYMDLSGGVEVATPRGYPNPTHYYEGYELLQYMTQNSPMSTWIPAFKYQISQDNPFYAQIMDDTFFNPNFKAWAWDWGYGPLLPYPVEESYWTESELEEQYESLSTYLTAIKQALGWWLVLHNADNATADFLDDLTIAIARINQADAGDPVALALLESGADATVISPASDSPYSTGMQIFTVDDVDPDAAALTQASLIDRYKEYWPYAAAAAVVGGVLLLKRK